VTIALAEPFFDRLTSRLAVPVGIPTAVTGGDLKRVTDELEASWLIGCEGWESIGKGGDAARVLDEPRLRQRGELALGCCSVKMAGTQTRFVQLADRHVLSLLAELPARPNPPKARTTEGRGDRVAEYSEADNGVVIAIKGLLLRPKVLTRRAAAIAVMHGCSARCSE